MASAVFKSGKSLLITFCSPSLYRRSCEAWATLRDFAQNDKQLQRIPGAIAVLHTHSRRLCSGQVNLAKD